MLHHQTPLLLHHRLSKEQGQNIYLKMDCYQPSGSFKIRGIGHLCTQQAQKGVKGFVSSSGGNAGLAVAYSGTIGAPVTICSKHHPEHVREKMRFGCSCIEHGDVWDESDIFARDYAERHQCSYIHPLMNQAFDRSFHPH